MAKAMCVYVCACALCSTRKVLICQAKGMSERGKTKCRPITSKSVCPHTHTHQRLQIRHVNVSVRQSNRFFALPLGLGRVLGHVQNTAIIRQRRIFSVRLALGSQGLCIAAPSAARPGGAPCLRLRKLHADRIHRARPLRDEGRHPLERAHACTAKTSASGSV